MAARDTLYPPSLRAPLTHNDRLAVVQEAATGRYRVLDSVGRQIFSAAEEEGRGGRGCCGGPRAFKITLRDMMGRKVLVVDRPMGYLGCIPCRAEDTTTVSSTIGLLGTMGQAATFSGYRFKVNCL